jgi:glycosyltransferase involved in cell wall biosynthesis
MNLKSKKIKISVIGPSWPFRGGIAKFTTELAEKLSRKGHLASFISPENQYPKILFPGKSDRDEQSCKQLSFTRSLYSYYQPWTWKKVIREIEASEAECIVAPHWSMTSAPFLSYLIRRSPKPVIPIVHNFSDHDSLPGGPRIMEWVLKGGAGYLHHNPEFSELSFFKKRADRVKCHLHPVTETKRLGITSAKKQFGIPKGKITFLFYGLIRKYKGLEVFLDALELLPESSPIALLIAGEPWTGKRELENRLNKLSKKFWIQSKLEWISEEETRIWFSAADAVVLPYLRATGSGVAAQAFAFQKPILTTRTGSLGHLVKSGVNGLVCKPGSPEELDKNIKRFLNPKMRERLNLGMRNVLPESWEDYVESLVSLAENSVEEKVEKGIRVH